ncbi:CCA tRNA nucleotidyltransferase [Sporosarcina beigongshangi]|uniref:CCA tRNA nucleotidyltransferase n=1 Tax=Sporosarcina beigongshangi TaxID=2782538 RepID=UPI001939EA95|nr:CCA tRNA nucleotidyltransferase [Sporosarcina beigongshangi]
MTAHFATESSREVIRLLEQAGYEAVFVGGAVRDYVLGKPATDIDIATSAKPEEVKALFPMTVDIGTAHGTVLVLIDGEPIEVTTYRTEGTYSDHRRPDEVQFVTSLREDLLRRDFTMNALAMTKDGELIDLFGGQKDMARQLIRAVGHAADRFNEDALRMFRAVRFTSVLDFAIEEETFEAIRAHAAQIQYISVERLKAEMDKLFKGVNPVKAFQFIEQTTLSNHLPLFPRSLGKLNKMVPFRTAVEGWACLMLAGDFTSGAVAKAYKLSNAEKSFLSTVHQASVRRSNSLFTIDDYYHFDLAVLLLAEKWVHIIGHSSQALSEDEITSRKQSLPIQSVADLVVTGKDLMAWAELRGGRWTGEWIEKITMAVLHGKCENNSNNIKEWFLNEFKREK